MRIFNPTVLAVIGLTAADPQFLDDDPFDDPIVGGPLIGDPLIGDPIGGPVVDAGIGVPTYPGGAITHTITRFSGAINYVYRETTTVSNIVSFVHEVDPMAYMPTFFGNFANEVAFDITESQIMGALGGIEDIGYFVALLQEHLQASVWSGAQALSMFIPTNAALTGYLGGLDGEFDIGRTLAYHVSPQFLGPDYHDMMAMPTFAYNDFRETCEFANYRMMDGPVYGNGLVYGSLRVGASVVVIPDVFVIHLLDSMIPLPGPIDTWGGDYHLGSFMEHLYGGPMAGLLGGAGQMTMFAPNDAAFDSFGGWDDSLMEYHMIQDQMLSSMDFMGLDGPMPYPSLGGELEISFIEGEILVNGARILQPDIFTPHGIVHIIDSVLELGAFGGFGPCDGGPCPEIPFWDSSSTLEISITAAFLTLLLTIFM